MFFFGTKFIKLTGSIDLLTVARPLSYCRSASDCQCPSLIKTMFGFLYTRAFHPMAAHTQLVVLLDRSDVLSFLSLR